jgi:hypothetical protein
VAVLRSGPIALRRVAGPLVSVSSR